MLRAVLVGLLSLTAVSCKSKDEPVKSQPGVAAGKVLELSGTVTLHRGAEARPVAKGDSVESDDVIETGADSSVRIELAHNSASWELGANKKVKVRDSLAWNEAKKDKTAVEQDSAAAGRHAERNAADTTVSAAAPAATEAMPAPKAEQEEKRDEAAPPPPPPSKPAAIAAPTRTAPPPPKSVAPERAKRAAAAEKISDEGAGGLGLTGTGAGGGGTGDGIGLGGAGGKTGGADAAAEARNAINFRLPELKRCFKETVKVTFKIDAQGRVAVAFNKPLEEREKQCADKVAHIIAFAKSATTVTIEVTP